MTVLLRLLLLVPLLASCSCSFNIVNALGEAADVIDDSKTCIHNQTHEASP